MNLLHDDNPFVKALTTASNLIILNWLFVFSCIPVFTVGASIAALHSMCLKLIHQEDSGILSGYFQAFRQNFRRATALWLLFLISGAVLAADFRILGSTAVLTGILHTAALICAGLVTLLWLILWVNVFTLVARYENSLTVSLKNSLLLGIAALPDSLILICLRLGVIYIVFRFPSALPGIVILSMFILFSGIAYLSCRILSRTFRRLLPEAPTSESGE